ncbi:alpha-keto acid decarboxylase family protein [Ancylobacter defluvii]|uniref:Indole-3-pyruvate decarboxylase n=1 Tax=Ancylobacter defluvii TaxID=1282440 RepID=A0A9W6NCB3_9HYPH|nr:thiamine pyrophosphate-binding protein [Ancylobacter defluvii]MBS7586337.1 alpha-keto acid decarboxylase family protein [Ancylobacter defluvii]GLK85618.1 indole-3-pyruvate decarboxylase [Ancylobacter defluvii]
MTLTVIQHVLTRLQEIGISDVFGVPGDFAFPVNDAICRQPGMRWIGCANELNAAYAADGYARIKGVAALSTTYGVGELSALAGVAGAYAERLPIFHLVGTPRMAVQRARAIVHHTLGTGEYDLFRRMSEPVVCAHAVMTPQNVAYETERLIAEALYHLRPVYMAFPADLANQPVVSRASPVPLPQSDPTQLAAATRAVVAALEDAETACLLPGLIVARLGAGDRLQRLVDASGLPFATMFHDKTVLDEQQSSYAGMYDGALMNKDVQSFVEGRDRIVTVGTLMTDFNTGSFTANLDPKRTIAIDHHSVSVDGHTYPSVELGDVLDALTAAMAKRDWPRISAGSLGPMVGEGDAPITAEALYPRWAAFIRPGDIVVAETGTASMGLGFARMPSGANFYNQTLWGAIGWATPAAVGAALADPTRRTVLITGEGSHQLTVQELGLFGQLGLKPVVFVLNNDGYLIERLLCKDPEISYNDIAPWRYTELPHAFGCDGWTVARVATCADFDAALTAAAEANSGAYIEVVTGRYEASPLSLKLSEKMKQAAEG